MNEEIVEDGIFIQEEPETVQEFQPNEMKGEE